MRDGLILGDDLGGLPVLGLVGHLLGLVLADLLEEGLAHAVVVGAAQLPALLEVREELSDFVVGQLVAGDPEGVLHLLLGDVGPAIGGDLEQGEDDED